jgi:hypothetical protein
MISGLDLHWTLKNLGLFSRFAIDFQDISNLRYKSHFALTTAKHA